jgi:hypothetical protein
MLSIHAPVFLHMLVFIPFIFAAFNVAVPSNLNITNISVAGPSCSEQNSSPPFIMNEKTDTSTGSYATVGFDNMGASAIPGKDGFSWTDCTMSVDFAYPKGFQIAGLTAVTHGFVTFQKGGMKQEVSLDMWFPSLPFLVVSLSLTRWYRGRKLFTINVRLPTQPV